MAHGYEYASTIKYITPVTTENFRNKNTQLSFMNELQLMDKELPDFLDSLEGGGWTINSRSITVLGNTYAISYLLQRLVV